MKPLNATQTFAGLAPLRGLLQALPREMRLSILRPALGKAAEPIRAAAKTFAPSATGALKESIAIKVLDGTDASGAALVGPDRGYYQKGKRVKDLSSLYGQERQKPANYAHLVEFGHVIATGGSLKATHALELVETGALSKHGKPLKRWKRGAITAAAKGRATGLVAPQPFMRPALIAGAPAAEAILTEEIGRGVERVRAAGIARDAHAA